MAPTPHESPSNAKQRLLALEEQRQSLEREIETFNRHREQVINHLVVKLIEMANLRDSYNITQKEINEAIDAVHRNAAESSRILNQVPVIDSQAAAQRMDSPVGQMGVARPIETPLHGEKESNVRAAVESATQNYERIKAEESALLNEVIAATPLDDEQSEQEEKAAIHAAEPEDVVNVDFKDMLPPSGSLKQLRAEQERLQSEEQVHIQAEADRLKEESRKKDRIQAEEGKLKSEPQIESETEKLKAEISRLRAEAETQAEQARLQAEEYAKREAEIQAEQARVQAEEHAKREAEAQAEQARIQAEEQAKREAETQAEQARVQAQEQAKREAEAQAEQARVQAQEQAKREAEEQAAMELRIAHEEAEKQALTAKADQAPKNFDLDAVANMGLAKPIEEEAESDASFHEDGKN